MMKRLLRKALGLNWVLVMAMFGLLVFGMFEIESAARHVSLQGVKDSGAWFAGQQRQWIILGGIVYFVTALLDYRWMKWLAVPMYLLGLGLMIKLTFDGSSSHQLSVMGRSFQPTQLMIASGIILTAVVFQYFPKINSKWDTILRIFTVGVLTGIPFFLVIASGDMGSAIVWVPVAAVALLVVGVPIRYLTVIGILAVGMLPLIYYVVLPAASPRGANRIELYLDMLHNREVDISKDAYAPYWAATAIGKAGWKGTGWKATEEEGSLHAKKFIPKDTAHTDYIFAVIAEEHGFRGSLLLVTSFTLLLLQCLFIAYFSRDFLGLMITSGVVALFFAHIFENIGMCLHLMPITGIPLPLISYSGTFVLICLFLLGLVQSVWVHRDVDDLHRR